MARATDSEWLLRFFRKKLTADEYNDQKVKDRLMEIFWAGTAAHRRLVMSKKKRARKQ